MFRKSSVAALILLGVLASVQDAAAQRVLLLHADPDGVPDVAAKIAATGTFTQVDLLQTGGPGSAAVPSVALLSTYQAVLVWSNFPFADPAALGTALADYVDLGGGVVQATFAFRTGVPASDVSLNGRWQDPAGGYLVFSESPVVLSGVVRTLVATVPDHPILDGITGFNGGSGSFHHQVFPRPGTTQVARWSDNISLVGARTGPVAGRIVGLNFFPPSAEAVAGGWVPTTDGARLMANALEYVMAPPPFSHARAAIPEGACICTPLVMNTDADGTQHWWVRALGGPLTLTAVAHAVNSVDPETVRARMYDPAGNLVLDVTAAYPAGQTPGFEAASSQTFAAAIPGALYRVAVTTPATPPTQSHYRLTFDGADAAAASSPSFASLEPDRVTWDFNVGTGEPFGVRVFVDGTPASTTTLNYTLIDPDGVPTTGSVTATTGLDAVISGVTAVEGTWALRVDTASDHYRLDKSDGADRGIYLSWQSAGQGTLHVDAVATTSGGASFTGQVNFTVRDASGAVVTTGSSSTGSIAFADLPSGEYTVDVEPSPGWTALPASFAATVTCDKVTVVETVVVDVTPPVVTVPDSLVAPATGTDGALVEYTAAAEDPGLGAVPVTCAPASGSLFPIGATTVTCTAVDAAGNEADAVFTVTVEDVTTEGRMRGAGFIREGDSRYEFVFAVREDPRRGERGTFSLRVDQDGRHTPRGGQHARDDRFTAREVEFVAFSDEPAYTPRGKARPDADTVRFSGVGRWNDREGSRFEVLASDQGEPGRHRDAVRITIWDPSGTIVAHVEGAIDGGNIQSLR